MEEYNLAVSAIRKKLIGKRLTYREIYAVMDEIAHERLGDILTTYFAASGYAGGFTREELYFLTKAMVETGEKLQFKGIVADKHSIGGIPGARTSLIVVPIVAAAGFTIPKSSSRAITSPGGTADDMEVLAPVELSRKKIYEVVKKTNGCIVWGGSFNIAPADDNLIKVEEPLSLESFDKVLVSIMAKKIAFGSNHIVIDLPYGRTAKVVHLKDAEMLKDRFEYLADRFGVKIRVLLNKNDEPLGRGIGPKLEVKEALKVLEQKIGRPLDLEERSLTLAGNLLDICLANAPFRIKGSVLRTFGNTQRWAAEILAQGLALQKLKDIVEAQGGNPNISSDKIKPGKHIYNIRAHKKMVVKHLDSKKLSTITKVLGAPHRKGAGIYLEKKEGETAEKGDIICTLYSETEYDLKEAKDTLEYLPIFSYK